VRRPYFRSERVSYYGGVIVLPRGETQARGDSGGLTGPSETHHRVALELRILPATAQRLGCRFHHVAA